MRGRMLLVAAAVVVVVAGILVAATLTEPRPVKAAAARYGAVETIPVTSASLVCPQVGKPASGVAQITYAATSAASGAGSALTAAPLAPGAAPAAVAVHPGNAWLVHGDGPSGALRVDVSGDLTGNVGVTEFNRDVLGKVFQLAMTPCEGPMTDAWFAGFSSGVGAHASLLLSNVDSVPASVDLSIWGDQSAPAIGVQRGIKVDPQSQVQVPLDSLEPGLADAVVHVSATAGRVVPAVRYDAENGSIPLGVEWLPRTEAPATTATVPGFLAGPGSRRLVIADTGDTDATVSLKLVTADGSFTPTGLDALTVPAGGVSNVDLTSALNQQAATVVVTSSEPVVVGGASTLGGNGGSADVAFTAAVPALTGSVIAPGGEVRNGRTTQLALTAPVADAHVDVTVLPSSGAPSEHPLTVPGGTTTLLDLKSITSDPAPGVVVTPQGGGAVFAAWSLQEVGPANADIAEIPLRAPIRSLQRAPAHANLDAALPGGQLSSAPPASPASPPASAPASPGDLASLPPGSDQPSAPASGGPAAGQSSSGPSSQPSP